MEHFIDKMILGPAEYYKWIYHLCEQIDIPFPSVILYRNSGIIGWIASECLTKKADAKTRETAETK